jgi:PAP_fibrillin
MPCGAPATNATLPDDVLVGSIKDLALKLETCSQQRGNAVSSLLSGDSWLLVYSNAPEIANVTANYLPFGFCLGKTYQLIDAERGIFENRASLDHPLHVGKLITTVVNDLQVAKPGTWNAVNVVNDRNNRVNVEFRAISLEFH